MGRSNAARWRDGTDALDLWCLARDRARFNRQVIRRTRVMYNHRLQYLLAVAICRRVADLLTDPSCHELLWVAEAFAEGTASLADLITAHERLEFGPVSSPPAAVHSAFQSLYWLGPDDYKVTQAVEMVIEAAGYRAAVAAGVLAADADLYAGKAIWHRSAFIAGKDAEKKELCCLIREVLGNPFAPVEFQPAWRTPTVRAIAQEIYERNDFTTLGVLGDALQDAGCTEAEIIRHCQASGPHVRGCWVVDGVLGKT
jgi:hypothetical protein